MGSDKEEIVSSIKELPDNLSYDELLHQLIANRLLNGSSSKLEPELLDRWIEISKLALEEKKFNVELQLKKEAEANKKEDRGFSAAYTAIIAAVLGFVTSSVVALIQGNSNLQLERVKFETEQKLEQTKFETGLIAKGIEPKEEQTRLDLLNFYIKAGLISNPDISSKLAQLVKDKQVPQGAGSDYEGREDLGNTQRGDGVRFKGRGYLQIIGRANYKIFGEKIGVDLVNNPDLAAQPDIAAKIAIQFMNMVRIKECLDKQDFKCARRGVTGGLNGIDDVNRKTQLYLNALKASKLTSGTLQIAGVEKTNWLKIHVPVLLKAMREEQITDLLYQSYILATADHESLQGEYMVEIGN